jgi:hypothetical protein
VGPDTTQEAYRFGKSPAYTSYGQQLFTPFMADQSRGGDAIVGIAFAFQDAVLEAILGANEDDSGTWIPAS